MAARHIKLRLLRTRQWKNIYLFRDSLGKDLRKRVTVNACLIDTDNKSPKKPK